jgi:hypothetical protein
MYRRHIQDHYYYYYYYYYFFHRTPWNWAHLEKQIVVQLFKTFPTFYGI